MSYRKIFALSLLSVLTFAGCASSSSSDDVCGNGKLDAGEACDGTTFVGSTGICPAGTAGTVVCSGTCTADTSACKAVSPSPNCNNSVLDAGEDCDGAKFADGKGVCPAGTAGTVTCSAACTVDTSACIPEVSSDCGNGQIDGSEECDKTAFAAGKDVCPAGTTGSVTCDDMCHVVTSACVPETSSDCGNGQIDGDEECDKTAFAEGKDVCPAGTTGSVTCDDMCHVVTSACQTPTETCGEDDLGSCTAAEEDTYKCDNGKLAMCMYGCWVVDTDCTELGMTCDSERNTCIGTCENNIFKAGGDSLNCTAEGKLCDVVDMCVDYADGFTCEDSVIKLNNKEFSYDCKNNTDNKIGCNTAVGCSDSYCDGSKTMLCDKTEGCIAVDDCAAYGEDKVVCSDKLSACVCTEEYEFCFEKDGYSTYAVCDQTSIVTEICSSSECSATSGCVPAVSPTGCGDGNVDSSNGETCDWVDDGGSKTIYDSRYQVATCNYYDKTKIFVSGAPTCPSDTCKLNISGCIEAKDSDYSLVKSFSTSSLDDIKKLTKDGVAVMEGTFGQGYSEYDKIDNGWSLGNWTTGTSFGKHIKFNVGAVDKNAVRVTFNTRRANSANSPKSLQVKILEDGKVVYISDVVELSGTEKTAQTFTYKHNKSSMTDMSFQVGAFNGKTGHVVFSDIKVSAVNAL